MTDKKPATLTRSQQNALHLYCQQVADALNDAGLDIEQVLKNFTMELSWSKDSVKEILWRTAQQRLLGKHSTTELNKHEDITKVYEAMNRFLAKLGVESIPFPSFDPGFHDSAPMWNETQGKFMPPDAIKRSTSPVYPGDDR